MGNTKCGKGTKVLNVVDPHGTPLAVHLDSANRGEVKQRQIGAQLGLFQSTVERALRLHRKMLEMGLSEPFVRLTELPSETNRLRRHRHRRYSFEPLDGYPR